MFAAIYIYIYTSALLPEPRKGYALVMYSEPVCTVVGAPIYAQICIWMPELYCERAKDLEFLIV